MSEYKPKKVKSGGGLVGVANVELGVSKGKPTAKVTFVGGDNEGKSFFIAKDKCPPYIQAGRWMTRLSAKGDEILSISPINGRFRGKVLKFSAQKGKDPAPYTVTVTTSDKKTYSFEVFNVVLEITQGKCKGMPIFYRLNYNFAEADDGTVGIGHLKSKYTRHLERFLELSGAWDRGEMKYVDNVLPNFEKRILRANKEFYIQLVDGWVDALYPLDDDEDDDEVEEASKTNAYGHPEIEPDPDEIEDVFDSNDLSWEESEK